VMLFGLGCWMVTNGSTSLQVFSNQVILKRENNLLQDAAMHR